MFLMQARMRFLQLKWIVSEKRKERMDTLQIISGISRDSILERNSGSDAASKREFRAQLQQTMGRRFSVRTIASFLFTSPRTGTQVAAGVLIANVPLFARQSRFYADTYVNRLATKPPDYLHSRLFEEKRGNKGNGKMSWRMCTSRAYLFSLGAVQQSFALFIKYQ